MLTLATSLAARSYGGEGGYVKIDSSGREAQDLALDPGRVKGKCEG